MKVEEKDLLHEPLTHWFVHRMESQQVGAFIQLFMKKSSSEVESVTCVDLVEFAQKTDDTRCQHVALFYRAVYAIRRKLYRAGFKSEADAMRSLV